MSRDITMVELLKGYSKNDRHISKVRILLDQPSDLQERGSGHDISARPRKQVHHRLDEAELASLVSLYLAGTNVKDLAAQFQVHRTTVTAHLQRRGVRPGDR